MFEREEHCSEEQNRAGKSGTLFGRTELCWKERNTVRKCRTVLERAEHGSEVQNRAEKSGVLSGRAGTGRERKEEYVGI